MERPPCCHEADPRRSDRHFPAWLLDNPLRRALFPPSRLIRGKVSEGMVVADLGSGPGFLSIPLAEAAGPRGRVFAVDTDEKAIARVRKEAEARGLTNLDTRVSSASDVGFIQDSSVDMLYGKGLLCCMADHAGAIREVRRVLKKGGSAYLSVRKGGSKADPRRVGRDEWNQILAGFSVEQRGEGLTERWAWVATG